MFRRLVHAGLLAGSMLLGPATAHAQKSFVDDALAGETVRLEARLKTEGARSGPARPAQQARRDAEGALARGNPRSALSFALAAVASDPADGQNWLAYARAARGVDPRDWNERYELQ